MCGHRTGLPATRGFAMQTRNPYMSEGWCAAPSVSLSPRMALPCLSDEFVRLHSQCCCDLLHSNVAEIVARAKWQQYVAVSFVLELQVFVLTRHHVISDALEESSHLARANRRQCETLLFAH